MLDSAADPDRNKDVRVNGLTSLTNLLSNWHPASVNSLTATCYNAAECISEVFQELEVFSFAETTATATISQNTATTETALR